MESFDVVVVGSGAGGMVAALRAHDRGLKVLLVEKSDRYGGTSAVSGGGIWVPNNDKMPGVGFTDSTAESLAYLKAATKGEVPESRLLAYMSGAPRMLRYVEEKTRLRFRALPKYPDYYTDLPGWKAGARTMEPEFFNASLLGKEFDNLRSMGPRRSLFSMISMGQADGRLLFTRAPGWKWMVARMMLLYMLDIPGRLKGPRNRRLALGAGLVGALRKSMMDRDIPLWLDTPFVSLIMEDGRAAGVVVRRDGKEMRIAARRGVVLAAGGFERNQAMRDHYLPQPSQADWSATPPNNTGDAIRAGLDVGAAIAQMDRAWWVPSIHMPGRESQWGLFAERASPGSIIVNRQGRRFVDEAAPYLEFGEAMYADQKRTGANVPAWMIFDATFRHRYTCGPLMPGSMRPDGTLPKDWLGKVYFRADTLAELARQIGVDADGLAGTVERMNGYAATGIDAEFHKGGNIFDTYYGDPSVKPNPCLAPLVNPPFYALRIDPGDIGTKGGLVIDDNGQVQSTEGAPIPGLYAAGNTTSAVMGPAYPGPGSTLGPAMTFGFLAADHIADSSRN